MRAATWLDALSHELAARGVPADDAAAVIVEAEGHLREASEAPLAVFGSPADYAAVIAEALAPDRVARVAGETRVRATGVGKRYRGRPVLEDVDLVLRDGEATLVIGRNGCGKSTLLRILAGVLRPDQGRVEVRGTVGYVPQDGGLVEQLRPDEHFVLFGRSRGLSRRAAVREGRRLAEELGWDAGDAPVAASLSGGTRAKLSTVLAALGRPDVLLLDEPYQGMDRIGIQQFWAFLWDWRDAGRAALVVTHDREAIEGADTVVELSRPLSAGRRRAVA